MITPKRIVLTGGPCGGKTTGKNFLQEKLSNFGWNPIFVPEVATLIIGRGHNPAKMTPKQYFDFQRLVFRAQLIFEYRALNRTTGIKTSEKPLIICDRGLMDGLAYMTPEMFEDVLAARKMTEVDARDRRYDGVFHLMTIANGKPELYSTANNPARMETAEEAVAVDLRTQNAWLGHPHLRVIDNSTLFEQKMHRLLNEVRRLLGDPVAIETERKFLVHGGVLLREIPVPFKKIQIEQVYLESKDGVETRIRRRSQEDCGSVYYETHKTPTESPASRIETENQISAQDYAYNLRLARADYDIIRKTRICFLWQNQYFELDIILEPTRLLGTTLLEIELTEENDKVKIPDWLTKVEEVTGNKIYSNRELARRPK